MATKKEKREAALAKRAAFLEQVKQTGLEAQTAAQRRRDERAYEVKLEAQKLTQRYQLVIATHAMSAHHRNQEALYGARG